MREAPYFEDAENRCVVGGCSNSYNGLHAVMVNYMLYSKSFTRSKEGRIARSNDCTKI
uniref:Uncharacterized protein n=1 Tax=Ciona intestinalis TaxID=7719 RepID=F6R3P8_CIOIN